MTGKIVQVIGPVIDIKFPPQNLPAIYNAIKIDGEVGDGIKIHLTAEVMQHIGGDVVRAVAMSSTDGLVRGMDAVDTGAAISVPVGEGCLGRIFNVLGEAGKRKFLRQFNIILPLQMMVYLAGSMKLAVKTDRHVCSQSSHERQ